MYKNLGTTEKRIKKFLATESSSNKSNAILQL